MKDQPVMTIDQFLDIVSQMQQLETTSQERKERQMRINDRRNSNYRINVLRLMRLANRAFPTKYMNIETEAGSVSYIEDVYMEKKGGKSRRMVRYSTYYNERPTTTNETTMDNFMRSRRFKYIN